jgi:hypothetical protein
MSFIIVGGLVVAGVSASIQYGAAKDQKIALEVQADQEKQSAKGRELERRQQLNRILSLNIVSMAEQGGEGTPQSIALSNARQASLSEGAESLSDRLRQAQLQRQGKSVLAQGKAQAGSTLLRAGTTAYTGGN